nr:hypothetical protein [Candidatus Sigynarchaeota archaeon]
QQLRMEFLQQSMNAIVRWDDGYVIEGSAFLQERQRLPSSIDIQQLPMIILCNFATFEFFYTGDRIPESGSMQFLHQYLEGLASQGVDVRNIKISPGLARYISSVMDPDSNLVRNYIPVWPDYTKIRSGDTLSFGDAKYYHSQDGSVRGARYNQQTANWEIAIEYRIKTQDSPKVYKTGIIYVPIINWVSSTTYSTADALVKAFTLVSLMGDIYHDYLASARRPTTSQANGWRTTIRSWNIPASWSLAIKPLIGKSINIMAEILNLYFMYSA